MALSAFRAFRLTLAVLALVVATTLPASAQDLDRIAHDPGQGSADAGSVVVVPTPRAHLISDGNDWDRVAYDAEDGRGYGQYQDQSSDSYNDLGSPPESTPQSGGDNGSSSSGGGWSE